MENRNLHMIKEPIGNGDFPSQTVQLGGQERSTCQCHKVSCCRLCSPKFGNMLAAEFVENEKVVTKALWSDKIDNDNQIKTKYNHHKLILE